MFIFFLWVGVQEGFVRTNLPHVRCNFLGWFLSPLLFFFQRRKKKSGFFVFILSKRTHGDLETVEKNVL